GLGVAVGPVGRAEQDGGSEFHDFSLLSAASWAALVHIRQVRVAVATTTPSWLRPVCRRVAMPWPGRDFEGRTSTISVSVYRVSPWNTGCGKLTASSPSCPMMVPSVSCGTDWPIMVPRVNRELTSGLP